MRFVVAAWFFSRLLVLGVLLASGHVGSLVNWDGAWYGSIVAHGYEFATDGKQHNVAFFPLLPIVAWPLVREGVPWPLAAGVLANTAFLGALVAIYHIARKRYDEMTARWCVATACLLPPSLFCSVAYPQSLFMLFSAIALYVFTNGYYSAGGLAAALASSAGALGIPLVAALVTDGALRRRGAAMAAALIGCAGIGAFMLYCGIRFHDALAFVHVQHAWRHAFGFDAAGWKATLASLTTPDGFRQNIAMLLVPIGLLAILFESRRMGSAMTIYGLLALAMLLTSGTMFSVDRNAYAIVPVLVAIGAILRRVPVAGYVVLSLSSVLLVIDASRFAHFLWVA